MEDSSSVTYEQLNDLSAEFDDAETELSMTSHWNGVHRRFFFPSFLLSLANGHGVTKPTGPKANLHETLARRLTCT